MTTTLDALLDDLGDYLGKADTACLSLPREAYISKELHALEVKQIFEKSWLCVGRDEYVPNPGDYYTIDVIDEPVIIVRGKRRHGARAQCRLPSPQHAGRAGPRQRQATSPAPTTPGATASMAI